MRRKNHSRQLQLVSFLSVYVLSFYTQAITLNAESISTGSQVSVGDSQANVQDIIAATDIFQPAQPLPRPMPGTPMPGPQPGPQPAPHPQPAPPPYNPPPQPYPGPQPGPHPGPGPQPYPHPQPPPPPYNPPPQPYPGPQPGPHPGPGPQPYPGPQPGPHPGPGPQPYPGPQPGPHPGPGPQPYPHPQPPPPPYNPPPQPYPGPHPGPGPQPYPPQPYPQPHPQPPPPPYNPPPQPYPPQPYPQPVPQPSEQMPPSQIGDWQRSVAQLNQIVDERGVSLSQLMGLNRFNDYQIESVEVFLDNRNANGRAVTLEIDGSVVTTEYTQGPVVTLRPNVMSRLGVNVYNVDIRVYGGATVVSRVAVNLKRAYYPSGVQDDFRVIDQPIFVNSYGSTSVDLMSELGLYSYSGYRVLSITVEGSSTDGSMANVQLAMNYNFTSGISVSPYSSAQEFILDAPRSVINQGLSSLVLNVNGNAQLTRVIVKLVRY